MAYEKKHAYIQFLLIAQLYLTCNSSTVIAASVGGGFSTTSAIVNIFEIFFSFRRDGTVKIENNSELSTITSFNESFMFVYDSSNSGSFSRW